MAESEERQGQAAEYVLGTLDPAERMLFETALEGDAELRSLVAGWERRLAPLALALKPVAVPAGLRERVMAAMAGSLPKSATVVRLERRARLWRGVAIGSLATAAALAAVLMFRPVTLPTGGRYVAVLQSEGPGPAFLASVDLASGTISVRSVAATVPQGKSYELWAVGAGREKPQSLGVIGADFRVPSSRLGSLDRSALGATVFAVSLEPEGGSPTGQPTGPVLFTGKLVATE